MHNRLDKVSIEGLALQAIIGVHDFERHTRQPVVIDLDLFIDITRAAETDNLEDTVSYGDVCRAITRLVESSSFNLVEALAESIAALVFETWQVPRLVLKVSKPDAVPEATNISITIERSLP